MVFYVVVKDFPISIFNFFLVIVQLAHCLLARVLLRMSWRVDFSNFHVLEMGICRAKVILFFWLEKSILHQFIYNIQSFHLFSRIFPGISRKIPIVLWIKSPNTPVDWLVN